MYSKTTTDGALLEKLVLTSAERKCALRTSTHRTSFVFESVTNAAGAAFFTAKKEVDLAVVVVVVVVVVVGMYRNI